MTWDPARARYADKMRRMGTPLLVTEEEFAAAARLMEKARRLGMSDRMIVAQTGVPVSLPSKVRRGVIRTMHRDTLEKLSKLHPERPSVTYTPARGRVGGGAFTDSTGTARRVQGLRADGFPGRLLGEKLGVSYEAVAQLARADRPVVLETTRLSVAWLYAELDGRWPHEFGVLKQAAGKCATYARRAGYVPRSCWDPGTIDDPDAQPEWTGHCGTPLGRRIHERDGIPVCPRCRCQSARIPFSGVRLRDLRADRGVSQRVVEEAVGIGKGHINHWENGRYHPRPEILNRVLSFLDATLEDVCEDT